MLRAEQITFESDENGWEMHVTDDKGVEHRFNVQGIAIDVLRNALDTIGQWYAKGLDAAVTAPTDEVEVEPDYDLARELERERWRPSR